MTTHGFILGLIAAATLILAPVVIMSTPMHPSRDEDDAMWERVEREARRKS